MRAWLWRRGVAMLALFLPCVAGIAYLAAFGAPQSYVLVNAVALIGALGWIAIGKIPRGIAVRRLLCAFLIAALALPLITGPAIGPVIGAADGTVSRWIIIGGLSLHTGMIAVPLLARLASTDRDFGPPIILAAMFVALIQPDAATVFALMLASVGMYFVWNDWRPGLVAIIGFIAGVLASLRGELPPQPFVERVFASLVLPSPLTALALFLSLIACFTLILRGLPQTQSERAAIAGTLAGFFLAALMSNYPTILVGYGAAPILGYALALAFGPPSRIAREQGPQTVDRAHSDLGE